jgi:hypothetical protein
MIYEDGAERFRRNRRLDIVNKAIYIVDNEATDTLAKLAEIYVAETHNWPYVDKHRPDDGFDIILPNGIKIDVKWSSDPNNNLITPKGYVFKSHYYWFVTGPTKKDFVERGWATRAEFISAPVRDLGHRQPTYVVEQKYLHPVSEFPYLLDRCDKSLNYHSNPHKGCILR